MFARRLFGRFTIRWIIGIVAALIAGVGGALILLAIATGLGNAPTFAGFTAWSFLLRLVLGLAAIWGAFRIYRAGSALLFARGRLAVSGFLTGVVGLFLLILGYGTDAVLVIAGGAAGFVGSEF